MLYECYMSMIWALTTIVIAICDGTQALWMGWSRCECEYSTIWAQYNCAFIEINMRWATWVQYERVLKNWMHYVCDCAISAHFVLLRCSYHASCVQCVHWKLLAGTPHSNTPVHKPACREPLWAKLVGHIELILYKMRVSCLRTNSALSHLAVYIIHTVYILFTLYTSHTHTVLL